MKSNSSQSSVHFKCIISFHAFYVLIPAGIASLNVAINQSTTVKLSNNETTRISLDYVTEETSASYVLTVFILPGFLIDRSASYVNQISKTVTFEITPASLDSLDYGTYELVFNLTQNTSNYEDSLSKTLVLFYEEPITVTKVYTIFSLP